MEETVNRSRTHSRRNWRTAVLRHKLWNSPEAGNKLDKDAGDIVSLQAQTSPYFQQCIEHVDKSESQLKTSP